MIKQNQRKKIAAYVKENGFITSYDAYKVLGITQLATRIKEMKEIGYDITTEWVHDKNKHYKKYYIGE